MSVGAVGNANVTNNYPNYVYNTNQVSAQSLGKVKPIPQDALQSKTDYSNSYSNDLNKNPLKPGQTANYQATVESQMSESDRNAARLMPQDQVAAATQSVQAAQTPEAEKATAPSDPAQDMTKNITEIAKSLNEASSPSADLMKIETPAEKAIKAIEDPQSQEQEPKGPAEKAAEQNDPSKQQNMSISEMASAINENSAPMANIMDQSGGNGSNAIPNVTL